MRSLSPRPRGQLSANSRPIIFNSKLPEDQSNATIEKAQTTITKYKHYLNRWALPCWPRTAALAVPPFEVESWLKEIEREHHLKTTTLAVIRKVMKLSYRHGQRCGLLPPTDAGTPT